MARTLGGLRLVMKQRTTSGGESAEGGTGDRGAASTASPCSRQQTFKIIRCIGRCIPMRIEGEHACTLWPETACSPLPRTRAQLCPWTEALLCYRTCPHSAIVISTVGDAGTVSWRPPRPRRCPRASCGLNLSACETRRPWRVLSAEPPPVVARAPGLAAGPDTLVLPWVLASLVPPPAGLLPGGGSRSVTGRRCGRPRGYGSRRSPLVPWEKSLVPWGEIPCTLASVLDLGASFP